MMCTISMVYMHIASPQRGQPLLALAQAVQVSHLLLAV